MIARAFFVLANLTSSSYTFSFVRRLQIVCGGGVGKVELELRDLLARSRTIESHKLMNRRHMSLSNPLSIGLQIGLRAS